MAKTKTATTLFMEKNFPAPPITPCPHRFFHVQSAYQAAKCDSDPARFGQYTTTVCAYNDILNCNTLTSICSAYLPKTQLPRRKNSNVEPNTAHCRAKNCKTFFDPSWRRSRRTSGRRLLPVVRRTSAPSLADLRNRTTAKKKTALQIALNAVVAAFTDAFPDGVRKPLSEISPPFSISLSLTGSQHMKKAKRSTTPSPS
jgi:hypothetical protein